MVSDSISLKLFLLKRDDVDLPDGRTSVLVVAANEFQAREIANSEATTDEGYVWTDGTRVHSQCVGLAADDVQGGILIWSKE